MSRDGRVHVDPDTALVGALLALLLALLSVGLIYFLLFQLGLVGLEPPEPVRYGLLALVPAVAAGYFLGLRRWLAAL